VKRNVGTERNGELNICPFILVKLLLQMYACFLSYVLYTLMCWCAVKNVGDQYILRKHDTIILRQNDVSFHGVCATRLSLMKISKYIYSGAKFKQLALMFNCLRS